MFFFLINTLIISSSCIQAFVHDPLINWRLFNFNEVPQMSMLTSNHVPPVVNTEESAPNRELPHPQRGARERELLQVYSYHIICYLLSINDAQFIYRCI